MNDEIKKLPRKIRKSVAECIVPDDLPDGAYFAMMEEFGVSAEDLCEED
jgi:hypothetical protein